MQTFEQLLSRTGTPSTLARSCFALLLLTTHLPASARAEEAPVRREWTRAPAATPSPGSIEPLGATPELTGESTSATAYRSPDAESTASRAVRPTRAGGTRLGLIVAGAAMLGGGWLLNIAGGALAGYQACFFAPLGSTCGGGFDEQWSGFRTVSVVPIFGPWIQLAAAPNLDNAWPLWLTIDGLAQLVGAGLLIAGVVVHEEPAQPPVAILPTVSPAHVGLTVAGRW